MEAQMQRPTHGHHHYEENPQGAGLHTVIEGEGEQGHDHHGEKKSVLKKVKDKAKKIKDTITKHGHHGHEHEHEHDVSEEEDDEDEEMVDDPEVHGAPMYDSSVIRSTKLPRQVDLNLEKPMDTREDRYGHHANVRDEGGISKLSALGNLGPQLERPPAMESHDLGTKNILPSNPIRERPSPVTEAHGLGTKARREKPIFEEPKAEIGPLMGNLEEDPHSAKNRRAGITPSNYESKVTDPTGAGGEADVATLVHRLDDLNVRDESRTKPGSKQGVYTGSHDQFAPQPNPTKDQFNPVSKPGATPESTEPKPKTLDSANPESMPRATVAGKLSSATAAIADKAVSAKNVVASKLGYGGSQHQVSGQDSSSSKPITESATEYVHTVAEKLAPVYEKVAGAGSAVMSKVQGGGGTEQQAGDATTEKGSAGDKGVSVKEYLVEKFRPGDEDKALCEAIASALHKKKETGTETGEHKPAMGKVTVSKEVAERLGTEQENKREGEDALAAGSESTGQGVMDRLKGAVSLWLGKSTGMQTAEESLKQSHVSDASSTPTGHGGEGVARGQRKLQESSH